MSYLGKNPGKVIATMKIYLVSIASTASELLN